MQNCETSCECGAVSSRGCSVTGCPAYLREEEAAEKHAAEATSFDRKTQYHMLKFRIAKSAFLAGVAWKARQELSKDE